MDNKIPLKYGAMDTALIISLCTILIAATFFSGNTLRNIVSAGSDLSAEAVLWSAIAGFLSVLSLSCLLSLVGKIISSMSTVGSGLWESLSYYMLRFCLYILTRWMIIWGIPFIIIMSVFLSVKPSLGLVSSIIACGITLILIILLVLIAFPKEVMKTAFSIRPFQGMKRIQAVFLIAISFLAGILFINSQYIFEYKLSKILYTPADVLELDITLKGRILNHDKLTATISMVKPRQIRKTLKFGEVDSGKYYSWINLSDLSPGLYEIDAFFSNFEQADLLTKLTLRFVGNNHLHKSFRFYIRQSTT